MARRRRSRSRRLFGLLVFRLVPMILVVITLWFSYGIAQAVTRQIDERSDIQGRRDDFPSTSTAIAMLPTEVIPTETLLPSLTPEPTLTPLPTDTLVSPTNTLVPTATNTALPPTNTPEPTATFTTTPTPIPPTETDFPTLTFTATSSRDSEVTIDDTTVVSRSENPSNTPRPIVFATNTPDLGGDLFQTATPVPTNTPSLTPTLTFTPTLTPSLTWTPTMTFTPSLTPTLTFTPTETPRPVPTVFFAPSREDGAILNGTAVPTHVPTVPRDYDLVNIILLGGDDELESGNFYRTDTMIIVSINRDTGTISMLSLPRDLFVYIPSGQMNRLNVVYSVGESIGWEPAGGFGLLRQTILYNFGINVHYYARVNFSGFQQIIDTMGGVEIAVDCAYQDYGLIGAEVPEDAVKAGDEGLYTLGVGYYEMPGAQALWYARTRRNSSDFDRGRRQQQLLRAIFHKAKSTISLTNAASLWSEGMEIIDTDMGLDDYLSLLPLVLSLDVSQIENYTLIHNYHTIPWQTPNGDYVQLPNYDTMRPLLEDFYRPPSNSQVLVEGATIAVYNGTNNPDWDRVAAERLAWEGFRAYSVGDAETLDYAETVIIDYTGQQKGSSLGEIASVLNINPNNIRIEPDPNRDADFAIFLGANYNSCDAGVLPVDE
jgi:polyisoprenyl-teichoic acid--peptidoglycan teichoic acid transferase